MNEETTKKSGKLGKILIIIGAIHAAILVFVLVLKKIWKHREEASKGKAVREYFGLWTAKSILPDEGTFEGMTVKSVMSAVRVNLMDADFADESFVSIDSTMSAIAIIVPENVKVIVDGKNKFGAIQDKCSHDNDESCEKVLYVAYNNKMSAISVSNCEDED